MQAKLHAYNVALLKLRSLVAWTDPTRTKVFVLFLLFAALLLATIPLRYTWAGAVVFLFTKPLRSMKKTVPELLLDDFWRGLPVDSALHTNLDMAAIYTLQE
ncbi:hypothetical protein JKP88DRAFT_220808 [Tribonema minus]|uniref:Multiple C2 domain-containing protein n=1 Tax=Tribonema minus TaxID=303371 RepID=A0A835YWJ6_9STRA|nr:hypothetical protein JKP88DRAFT_220808 [Tribonema minus]